ncbi:MAG: hypothetical protein ACJASQ_000179 [Crocinitomicaceae bacterium]|jgi:hypothetical protein
MKEVTETSNTENLYGQEKSNARDRLILIAILISAFSALYWVVISKYIEATENFEISAFFKGFGYLIDLGMVAAPVLLAFSIKRSKWRVLALVFGIICAVIRLYWFFKAMMPVPKEEFVYFEF